LSRKAWGRQRAWTSAEPAGKLPRQFSASHRRRTEAAIEKHASGETNRGLFRRTIHGHSRLRQKCSKVTYDGGFHWRRAGRFAHPVGRPGAGMSSGAVIGRKPVRQKSAGLLRALGQLLSGLSDTDAEPPKTVTSTALKMESLSSRSFAHSRPGRNA